MKEISIKQATFINAIAKYSVVIMNILFTSVLARLLTPEDYGVIAIVTIFTTLFAKLCDMGFGVAVIQFKDLDMEAVNHIFSFTGIIALALGVLFAFLGKPISLFYQSEVYKEICAILAVSVFFNCLNMVPNAVLLRDKRFVQVGIRNIAVNIVGYVVAILCAALGGKYYALVLQSVIASVANYIWNNHTAKLRFVRKIEMQSIKKVWNYSFFQFIFGWVNYLETNLDNILIGGFMGSTSLAYYDKGYKLISYPMNNISGVVTPALHPILKDYQNNKNYLCKRYVEVQKILSILAIIIVPIFFCASGEIIQIMFGAQWGDTTVIFQLLSLSIYPKIMMGTTGAIYCSAGNTKMLFLAGTVNAFVTSIGIIGGILVGTVEAVAMGVSIANWSNMFVTFTILFRIVLKHSVWLYFKAFIGDFCVMTGMCVITIILFYFVDVSNILVSLGGKICIVGMIYMGYLFLSGKIMILKKHK